MNSTKEKKLVPRTKMRSLRLAKKLSQHGLAVKIGCTENHIRFIERGRTDPSVKVANEICNALSSDVYEIFPDIFNKK